LTDAARHIAEKICRLFYISVENSLQDTTPVKSTLNSEVIINDVEMEEMDLEQNGTVFSCSQCDFTSSTISAVSEHIEVSHESDVKATVKSKEEEEESKDELTDKFSVHSMKTLVPENKHNLIKHVQLESHDVEVQERVKEENIKGDQSTELCILSDNMKKPIKCEVCGSIFSSVYTLKRHMATHNKLRPFKCKLCNKSFTQKVVLKEHILMHTGEKRFLCNVCDKTFQQSNHLKYHLLSAHNIGKRHSCEDCGKVYIFKHQLTSHISKVHGDLAKGCFTCMECPDRVFMTKTKYNMHLETFHTKKKH